MRSIHDLDIHEEVLLMGLDPVKGVPVGYIDQRFAIGGAILVHLAMLNRIEAQKARGGQYQIAVIDSRLTGDATVDRWLERIRSSKKRTLKHWLTAMVQDTKMRSELSERLWLAGILRKEERSVLLFFSRNVYPTLNLVARERVRERARSAILQDGIVDARSASLALILHNAGIVSTVMSRQERKAARARIKALADGQYVADRPDVVRLAALIKGGE